MATDDPRLTLHVEGLESIEKLTARVAALTSENESVRAENTKLRADMADFDKRLATELAKRGIRPTGAVQWDDVGRSPKLTATDKAVLAKGVSSVDQLEQFPKSQPAQTPMPSAPPPDDPANCDSSP